MPQIRTWRLIEMGILSKSLVIVLLLLTAGSFNPVRADDGNSLISVTKQVIRAAAMVGFEEAGTRIMGSAWRPFKAMIAPVITELENRFPSFFLLDTSPGSTPPVRAQEAAQEALNAIDDDISLRRMIVDGFNKLDEGQFEIKQQVEKISLRLDAIDVSIDDFAQSSDEKFAQIMDQLDSIRQQLDQGQSIEFRTNIVLFPLTFRLPDGSVDATVRLFVSGNKPVTLSVNKNRPSITVNVAVPRPGLYPYQIEHEEVATLYRRYGDGFQKTLVPITSTNTGQVRIVPNSVYKLVRSVVLGGRQGNTVTIELTKALTPGERGMMENQTTDGMTQEEANEFLDQLDRELSGQ